MNNWWHNFYEKWVVRLLVIKPFKYFSYFFSHGGIHLVMCGLVAALTYQLASHNIESSDTTMHNINVEIEPPKSPSSYRDTLHTLLVKCELDSDTLLKKTNNKYKSRINISYGYDYTCRDSQFVNTPKEPTVIRLYSEPFLDDLYIEHDSTFVPFEIPEIKETENNKGISHSGYKILKDSVIEITVNPVKNVDGVDVGTQTIYIYSNKLGMSEGDSYYNYLINFGNMPLIKETTNFEGLDVFFQIGDETSNKGYYFRENKRLLYQYVFPQPDMLKNGYLEYTSEEAISKVKENRGITVQATDIDALNRNNKISIVYSVLVGTGAALVFDILIQLVRELRNVNRRKEEEERREQEEKEENNN
jgi:hypothetical protein